MIPSYRVVCYAYGRELGRAGVGVDFAGHLCQHVGTLFRMLRVERDDEWCQCTASWIVADWPRCEQLVGVGIGVGLAKRGRR